jgi:ribonuclease P protein component
MGNKLFHFSKQEVSDLFKNAPRVLRVPSFDFLCFPSAHPYGRLLAITPVKLGTAPVRNKIRRQCKAIFYEQQLSDHNLDCLLILKKPALTLSFQELQELITHSILQAKKRFHRS